MGRLSLVVSRLLQAIPLLLGVVLLVFLLLRVTPGDPARTVAGERASERELEQVRADLGLNDPLPVQYVKYVGDAASGDLGTSIRQRVPVTEVVSDRIPVTLALLAVGSILGLVISVPLATVAARRRDRLPDHFIRLLSLVALTMPAFWVGALLLVTIALPTGWFPISGYGTSFGDHVRALVLPSLTVAISLVPILVRSMRSEFIEVRESDYIAMARACGIGPARLALRHELPNALVPSITLIAVSVGYLLFAVVVVENTFNLPGLGQAMVSAVSERDFPVIQGITLIFSIAVVFVYLIADILYALIDPRIALR